MGRFMKNIKVSIITPCYNSEKTIRRTIESVLNQTYHNIEYIIIDGKSTDNTVGIIDEYTERFKGRLKYVSEKDTGIYNAMNKGIKISTGDIIGIINSDDFYEIDAVEKVVNHMTKALYQIVYGYCNSIDINGNKSLVTINHKELYIKMIPHPTCFVTRKTYCKYGLFLEWMSIAADYEFMLRISKKEDVHFIQIKEILANFYEGGISTQSDNLKKLKREHLITRYMHGTIGKKEFVKAYIRSLRQVENNLPDKYFELFMMMNCWVQIKQEGKSISDYFENKGYRDIAIYGMGHVGERLLYELKESKIHVKYGIDKRSDSIYADIDIVTVDEPLDKVDVIIVTAITFFDEIEKNLRERINCPIVSLRDILYEIVKEIAK